jgi:hypothetical protein
MPYHACLILRRKWSTRSDHGCSTFPFITNVVTRNLQILHYRKKFGSLWPRVKEKASLESFTIFFNTGKIIPSRSRPSFEALFLKLGNSHNVMGNACGSQ